MVNYISINILSSQILTSKWDKCIQSMNLLSSPRHTKDTNTTIFAMSLNKKRLKKRGCHLSPEHAPLCPTLFSLTPPCLSWAIIPIIKLKHMHVVELLWTETGLGCGQYQACHWSKQMNNVIHTEPVWKVFSITRSRRCILLVTSTAAPSSPTLQTHLPIN